MQRSKFLLSRIAMVIAVVMSFSYSSVSAQWTQCNGPSGFAEQSVFSLIHSGTSLFAGTLGNGIFRSTDNGENWMAASKGLTSLNIMDFAVYGTFIFAATTDSGVFRSTDNGENWMSSSIGMTNQFVMSLVISGTSLFAGMPSGGGVFRSTDNGMNWTSASVGLTNRNIREEFVVSGTTLFVGADQFVFRSTNNGESWNSTGKWDSYITALAVNGTSVFVGTENNDVYRTTDNGESWNSMGGRVGIGTLHALTVVGAKLFIGFGYGKVFFTPDVGGNWTDLSLNLTNKDVRVLTASGTTLFAATLGAGVWKYDLATGVETDTKPEPTHTPTITAHPNPTSSTATITVSPEAAGGTLEVFNIYGAKVYGASLLAAGTSSVDVAGLTAGLYSVVVTAGGAAARTELVVMR